MRNDPDRMTGYYARALAGERLRRCYELASPRVRQYLEAEIGHVRTRLPPGGRVLELGCGYGRVALALASPARRVVGIDTATESLVLGRSLAGPGANCDFLRMDALSLAFRDGAFDAVVCVQNGVCAFGVEPAALALEALRITRPGGTALFSTYLDAFWPHRLEWFEAQAREGLVGELDGAATGGGTIVCKDGFRSGRLAPADWRRLGRTLGVDATISEVDGSSLFWEVTRLPATG